MNAQVSYKGLPLHQRIRLSRPLTSYTRVQALLGAFMGALTRNRWTAGAHGAAYLNIGCGPNLAPGFINLDYVWRPGLQVCWDVTKRLPFQTGSLDGAYSEHCLEHVERADCENALREFFRILRPGGRVRIVVPDAEIWLRSYASLRAGRAASFPNARAGRLPVEEVNQIFRDHGHRFAYDFELMAELLRRAGFVGIERCAFRVGLDPTLLIDSASREEESLYVEAMKPHDSV